MVKYLAEKLARVYARGIASYIAMGITFAVIKGVGWVAAHYPPIGSLCDTQAMATWTSLALAAVINDVSNRLLKNDAAARQAALAVAVDLQKAPLPVLKAEAVQEECN